MKRFFNSHQKTKYPWLRRLGWGSMAVATLLVVWHSLGIDTPRSAITKAGLDILPLSHHLASHCAAPGDAISEAQLRTAEGSLPFKIRYVKSYTLVLEGAGAVNLTLRLEPIYDFEPFKSWGYAVPGNSLLILQGRCEEKGRFRWRTSPDTTVPRQRLPLLLRYQDEHYPNTWF